MKKELVLPKNFVDTIEKSTMSKSEKMKSYAFLDKLITILIKEKNNIYGRVEMPSTLLKRVVGENYKQITDKLIDLDLICRNDSYSNFKDKVFSKSYYINNKKLILDNNLLTTDVEAQILSNLKSVTYTTTKKQPKKDEKPNEFLTIRDMYNLKIDKSKLVNALTKRANSVDTSNFKFGDNVSGRFFSVSLGSRKYKMTKDKALEIAKKDGMELIQDRGNFIIDSVDNFIKTKRFSIIQSGMNSITKITSNMFFAERNNTNRRLDSNITNLPKEILKEICTQNELTQIDLKNSQFSILSHILDKNLKTSDFLSFKALSISGELYDYIKEKMSLESRNEAKNLMFEILFAKENSKNPFKKDLHSIFPTVIGFIDDYKKQNGYNNFSIMLQKKESEIFIDGIYKNIKDKKMFCLTKHDSVIVKTKDLEKVNDIIEKYFKKIGFSGKIYIE